MDCDVDIDGLAVRLVVVYRPPPSKANGLRNSGFLDDEWPTFLTRYATTHKDIIIVGDMNFHLDVADDRDAQRFTSVLESCGLQQHIHEPTHVHGHTLDVVITRDTSNLVSDINVTDPGLCDHMGRLTRDHYAVSFTANIAKPAPCWKTVSFRKLRSIDVESFKRDIAASTMLQQPGDSADVLVKAYNDGLKSLVSAHAPLRTKTIVQRPGCPWYTDDLHQAKHLRRKLERKWRNSRLTIDQQIFRNQCVVVNKLLKESRVSYYSDKVNVCGRDTKGIYRITKPKEAGTRS